MTLRDIYYAGYRDGQHDGYNSTVIENGVEESYYGKGFEFDKMTNGDVIRALFPQLECDYWCPRFADDWWNAPYKAESEDKE